MSNFCGDIHYNLSLTLTSRGVKVGPCCWFSNGSVIKDLSADLWNTKLLQDLRELNKTDVLTNSCSQCTKMELNGGRSRRTGVNDYYKSTDTDLKGPRGLEISIDYTCNIACVYCSPSLSTQWRLELATPKNTFPIRLDDPDIVTVLDQLDLSNLDNIHFYGGDPLLTRTHETILEYIDKRVGLQNIYVWYNTNGTIRVKDRILDLWSRCKIVKVFFSIDDIGARFEYLRYGAVWNQVEDNMFWYREVSPNNVMFTVQPTVSCLNAFYHHQLIDWKTEHFDKNRLGDLTDLTRHNVFGKFELEAMPDELRLRCLENNSKDQWFTNFVGSFKHDDNKLKNTKILIQQFDRRRGCDFTKTFPEIAPYFS